MYTFPRNFIITVTSFNDCINQGRIEGHGHWGPQKMAPKYFGNMCVYKKAIYMKGDNSPKKKKNERRYFWCDICYFYKPSHFYINLKTINYAMCFIKKINYAM